MENMMSATILRSLMFTFVVLFSFQHVTSRSTRSLLNASSSPDIALTTPPTRITNEMENTTSLFEASRSASLNTSLLEEQNIPDDNTTVEQNLSQQYVSSNVTSLPALATHNVSTIETSSVEMEIHEQLLTEYYDVQLNNRPTQSSADPRMLQNSDVDLVTYSATYQPKSNNDSSTTAYDVDSRMSSMASITQEITTGNTKPMRDSASTSNLQDNNSSEEVEVMTSVTVRTMETEFETITVGMLDLVTKDSLSMYTTTERSAPTDDGFQIEDLYLPLAVSLIIIMIWLLLSFLIYILACNRTTSRRSTYSISASGAYSNKAFVAGEVATDDRCYDDDGIEILRTAL